VLLTVSCLGVAVHLTSLLWLSPHSHVTRLVTLMCDIESRVLSSQGPCVCLSTAVAVCLLPPTTSSVKFVVNSIAPSTYSDMPTQHHGRGSSRTINISLHLSLLLHRRSTVRLGPCPDEAVPGTRLCGVCTLA
jgi:hypothetical protein